MSQYPPGEYPPSLPPLQYMGPGVPMPNPRPRTVTVVAILAIVFGSLGVLLMLCALPQYLGLQLMPNPMMDAIRNDRVLFTFTVGSLLIGMAISAVHLFGGISSLGLRAVGRKMLIGYAIANIATTLLGLVVSLTVVHARNQQVIQSVMAANPSLNTPTMRTTLRFSESIGVVTSLVYLIWPVLVLYFMSRPHVKAAFGKAAGMGERKPSG